MPIARIQMADGRIARIEVPEGTSPDEAQRMAQSVIPLDQGRARLERQIANLPPEAQRIGREKFAADPRIRSLEAGAAPRSAPKTNAPTNIAPQRTKGTGIAPVDWVLGGFNEALLGIPQGLENMGAAFTDPLVGAIWGDKALEGERQKRQARYDTASRYLSTTERPGARMVGQIASAVPLSGAKAPAMMGKYAPVVTRALQGAIGGAAVRDSNTDAAPSMGIGAVANVALPPVVSWAANSRYGKPVVDATKRMLAPAINTAGGALDDASEALLSRARPAMGLPYKAPSSPAPAVIAPRIPPAIPSAPVMSRADMVRAERLRRSGVTNPTTAMVTRNPNAWTFEQETAKRYGDVGQPMQNALLTADQQLGDRARQIIRNEGGSIGPEAVGQRVIDAAQARDKALSERVGGLYKQVRDTFGDTRVPDLANMKALPANPDWGDNAAFDDMLSAVNKRLLRYADADGGASGLTVSQGEELRKFIGGLGADNSQTFAMRRVIQNALDADVIDNIGGAPFANARAAAAARFDEFRGTLPGKMVDEAIAPELVAARMRGAGTSLDDLRALRLTLEQAPGGQEALQSLRSQVLDDVLAPALNPEGGVAGAKTYQNFVQNAPRLRALVDPSTYKDVRRFALAARDARAAVPNSNVNYSNTASAYGNMFAPATAPARGALDQTIRNYAPRAVGGAVGGLVSGTPGAFVGYATTQAAQEIAARRATDAMTAKMAEQVMAAQNPQLAMQMARDAELKAMQDAALLAERDGLTGLLGSNPVIGGTAAGLFGKRRKRN